jgi:tetratricopeptide (TPR) repeat protein
MVQTTRIAGFVIILCLHNTILNCVAKDQPVKFDTAFINSKNREAFKLCRIHPEKAISLAQNLLGISQKKGYDKGMADAYITMGYAYLAKYNIYDSANICNNHALSIYSKMRDYRGMGVAYHGQAYVYSFKGNLMESKKFSFLSLQNFLKANDKRWMVNAYHVLSYLYKQYSDYKNAIYFIEKAIDLASEIRDTSSLANMYNSLGNIYNSQALFRQSIDIYFKALNLWESQKDSSGMSIAYGSIGIIYLNLQDYNKALEFLGKKLQILTGSRSHWEISKTHCSIAKSFNALERYNDALQHLQKSLQLNNFMNYPRGIADTQYNLANTYLLLSNTDSAMHFIIKAIELGASIKEPELYNYYITLGNVYLKENKIPLSLKYIQEGYDLAKNQNEIFAVSQASKLLSDVYSRVSRFDLAYKYLKEHKMIQDSINKADYLKQTTRLEIQYEFDKKQRALAFEQQNERMAHETKMKQQKTYLKGLIILLTFIIFSSVLIIRQKSLKAKYVALNMEQKLLRTQMNPHFIFNSLCAIQDFILSNNQQKANKFLTKIAQLIRSILENSREEYISLEKEIQTLSNYLEVQKLRFETDFEYKIELDDAIDAENFAIPPMLAQPCVENAIEHGLLPKKQKGIIIITYHLKDELIRLEITDNGIGRDLANTNKNSEYKKQSLSVILTQERIQYFQKAFKKKGISYEIVDLTDNGVPSGTKVVFMVPYKKMFA